MFDKWGVVKAMSKKRNFVIAVILTCAFILTGCSQQGVSKDDSSLKFAYISKDLNHYWFQQVENGIQSKCEELGISVTSFDAQFDDVKCMEAVQRVVDEKYDGLFICTTNQQLGPQIGDLCQAAGIQVITIDDPMKDSSGKSFPYVGMATREMGAIGGVALAKLAKEKNFFEEGNNIKIFELDVPSLSVFRERLSGYEEALLTNTSISKDDILVLDVPDGMYEKNYEACIKYFSEQPEGDVTHWIICGVNDDSALAPMHALRDLGFDMDNVIACGLGGYELSIAEFEEGNRNYITTMTQPDVEGSKAVEMLYEYLVNGSELASSVVLGGKIATCDNYLVFFNYNKLSDNN